MLSINTNIPSLIAQTSLKTSTQKLNTAIERMTTGYKINGAKDNAANYSISTNMGVKLSSYQVAEDNCAMGLDLVTTASESLSLINDKLLRLRALAEQAANGTYGEQSLKAINSEASAIVNEIERTYSNTEYNGIKLFGKLGGFFIKPIERRDTSGMTKLSTVDSNEVISTGRFSISTAEEFAKLAEMTNNGKIGGDAEFVLADNIDLSAYSSGAGWTPIGTESNGFEGTFDGNGYVISNLYINNRNTDQGLFGYNEGVILNVSLLDASVSALENLGCLAGSNYGTIINCNASGQVIGGQFAGGLVGGSMGVIASSYATCEVSGSRGVGGFIGANGYGKIVDCYSTRGVTGESQVGGFCGRNLGTVTDCYSNATVTGEDDVGGFVGDCREGNIERSYSLGLVVKIGAFRGITGGFVGSNSASIRDCFYSLETSGQKDDNGGDPIDLDHFNLLFKDGILSRFELHEINDFKNLNFQIGINSQSSSNITLNISCVLNVSPLRGIGLDKNDYFSLIDNLISNVSAQQIEFGSVQNRLESALDEISTQYENLVSSRSTLRDADIAEVSSEYIRQQILQQASATLLATANQTPALALQLL